MSIEIADHINHRLIFSNTPKRVVSCVPSLTETLIHCGIYDKIVGRTKFCIHPRSKVENIPIIGGTKNLNIEKIFSLNPDLIIANKEENTKEDIAILQKKYAVYTSDITNIKDTISFLRDMGTIFKCNGFNETINAIETKVYSIPKYSFYPTVVYLIWRKPYMTVGGDTYIHSMLTMAGYKNIFGERMRYPEVTPEALSDLRPDFIFLSSEPYPFKEKHIEELNVLIGNCKILLIDGEMFSWYGSKLIEAVEYFKLIRERVGLSKE